MENYIESLSQNPWLIVLSAIVTVISLFVAIILYFKGRRIKRVKVVIRSINLLRDSVEKIDGLKILYAEKPIPNVTVTKLAIWNDGNETINGDDIAPADPLVISCEEEYNILESKIIYEKNHSNVVDLRKLGVGNRIAVVFDYLDRCEGAVIQILHTGKSSNDIRFTGTIKGVGEININNNKNKKMIGLIRFIRIPKKVVGWVSIIAGVVFPMLILALPEQYLSPLEKKAAILPSLFITALYIFSGYIIIKKRVPKGYDIFEENI